MRIVRLGRCDEEVVLAGRDLFDAPPREEWTTKFLSSEGHHLLVAFDDDRPVGFISGVETSHPDKGTEMFLYELSVHPEYRRRGIGKALVGSLADLARSRGCYGMWVGTEPDNAAALGTYRAAGASPPEPFLTLTWSFEPADIGAERAVSLRAARAADAATVADLVELAYGPYVARIGTVPGPMQQDYAEVIEARQVTVAETGGSIVGVIVFGVSDEGFTIENVAVHPHHRRKGIGRTLLGFAEAEARRAGFDSVYLYTHERMTENLAFYAKIGYVEYDRRSLGDFSLVYLRKRLDPDTREATDLP